MAMMKEDLMKMAVKLTCEAVKHQSEVTALVRPEQTVQYLQAVYDKLKEINDSAE